ncbi:MAG: DUF4347 domain-containing protein [Myxococcales bacterium FL481]|nr:MAG: DUF4347 domain-containing protein [Myxococcales bacterium FL481]
MVFDRTCTGRKTPVGLSHAWRLGALLYGGLRRLDAWLGAADWPQALRWLADTGSGPIDQIQYWGHGHFGQVRLGDDRLDLASFDPDHVWASDLRRISARLHAHSLVWFRTCETFGSAKGHAFARAAADTFGCRVAGHTHRIGSVQSGLHCLAPGQTPRWSTGEGIVTHRDGRASALGSRVWYANTITCLHGTIPPDRG